MSHTSAVHVFTLPFHLLNHMRMNVCLTHTGPTHSQPATQLRTCGGAFSSVDPAAIANMLAPDVVSEPEDGT